MLEDVTPQNYPMMGNLDLVEKLREFTGLDFLAYGEMKSEYFRNSKGVHWNKMSKDEKIKFVEAAYDKARKERCATSIAQALCDLD